MLYDFSNNLPQPRQRNIRNHGTSGGKVDRRADMNRRTRASSCTHVSGISASMSMAVDMEGGMASYVGAAGAGVEAGAGNDAAKAAAIDGAAIFYACWRKLEEGCRR